MKKYGIGIVGCGNISDIYFKNITECFDNLELIGCCDLIAEKALAQALKYNTTVYTLEELLANKDVAIILNITIPIAHKEVCEKALLAGKHVYVEKPLSLSTEDGKSLIELAQKKNLYIGGAPDTFLGGGIQTCIQMIQDGVIGDVIGAHAFMLCHGHESWHPAPEFYYKKGGGPMFDMGPYYLTALAKLIGPVNMVAGMTSKAFEQRTITSEPLNGTLIDVDVMTHTTALLRLDNNAIGYITMSFDVWGHQLPRIEVYGTKGTLSIPDPNTFDGPILLKTPEMDDFEEVAITLPYTENSRGLGIANMASAIEKGTGHEASGALTYHVLEIMEAIHTSSDQNSFIHIESRF